MAHTMRIEAVASANVRSGLEADAVARGALEFARSVLDGTDGSTEELEAIDWEAREVGTGLFWVFRPDLGDDGEYTFGLVDEASRVNLNSAASDMLLKLPGMTAELADSIIDWRDGDADVSSSGAESEYYLLQRPAYYCKDAPLETVEEVLLVRGATTELLYGEDANRNAVLDPSENDGEESYPSDNSDGRLDTGFLHYVTVYSAESNRAADGSERVNVNDFDTTALSDLLGEVIVGDRVFTILQAARRGRPYENIIEFYQRSGLTQEEFAQVADRLTTSDDEDVTGLVNVNTAPREVLLCLPELDESDVDDLLVAREDLDTDTSSVAWVSEMIEPEKAAAVGSYITTRSYQFSADILAVSGDGRAYRRCRAVLDARESPPRVVCWQDLTHLGWPLDADIIAELRAAERER
jgi:type II secretory pathway component PulK